MKKVYFIMLALAGCLTSCVKDAPVSSSVTSTSSIASAKNVSALKSLYSAQDDGNPPGVISISYDSAGNSLTIIYNPTGGSYSITVTSIFKGTLYSNANETFNSIVINTHLQATDIVTVTIADDGGVETASLYVGALAGSTTATPPPGRFYINVTSNLGYTQLNVTWTYSGGNPYTAGKYYIYFSSWCPDRNVAYSNIGNVSAGAATYTYTWYRPYTTYDSAYINVMIKGVPIPGNDPITHFFDNGSKGSYIYLSNLKIPQTYSGNFQNLVYPWVLYYYDGCNGPCVVEP